MTVVASRLTVSGTLYAMPFYVGAATSFSRIGAEVTMVGAAGSVVRLGIYGGAGVPSGAPVLDAGTVAGDVVASVELTIAQTLQPGQYWLCTKAESAGTYPSMRAFSGTGSPVGATTLTAATGGQSVGYAPTGVAAGAFGTFPTGSFASILSAPAVVLKVA